MHTTTPIYKLQHPLTSNPLPVTHTSPERTGVHLARDLRHTIGECLGPPQSAYMLGFSPPGA